jgi:hypothetical protein
MYSPLDKKKVLFKNSVILRYDGLIVHFKSFNFLAASQLVCRRLQIFI